MIVKEYPKEERPREKAIRLGLDNLSNAELLAILLRTGSKELSVIELAQTIINDLDNIGELKFIGIEQLKSYKGISDVKAIELLACVELAKRILTVHQTKNSLYVKEPIDGYNIVKNELLFCQQEHVIVLCLNNQLELIRKKTLFIGTNNISIISGPEIFKEALMCGSNRIMIIHNHPSGNPHPSSEDVEITERLHKMSDLMSITLIDHLIIGNDCFYSFSANKVYNLNDD